jgi:hypothetical protein
LVNGVFASGNSGEIMVSTQFLMVGTLGEPGIPAAVGDLQSQSFRHRPGFLVQSTGPLAIPTPTHTPTPCPTDSVAIGGVCATVTPTATPSLTSTPTPTAVSTAIATPTFTATPTLTPTALPTSTGGGDDVRVFLPVIQNQGDCAVDPVCMSTFATTP